LALVTIASAAAGPVAGRDHVVAAIAVCAVLARAGPDRVVAVAGVDLVVAGVALEPVIAGRTDQEIRSGPAADSVASWRRRVIGSPKPSHTSSRLSRIATMLEHAETDMLAFYASPNSHWRKLRSTTRLSASTKKSAGAPTSSASSPTTAA
jgi:hypothetical protein